MFEFIKKFFGKTNMKPESGPNTLSELLDQFKTFTSVPKSQDDIVRDYAVKESMASLELSFLKNDPAMLFNGNQIWYDQDGNKYFDFVPCALRPEVHYCCYGKN